MIRNTLLADVDERLVVVGGLEGDLAHLRHYRAPIETLKRIGMIKN